jgi:hypothetical protein
MSAASVTPARMLRARRRSSASTVVLSRMRFMAPICRSDRDEPEPFGDFLRLVARGERLRLAGLQQRRNNPRSDRQMPGVHRAQCMPTNQFQGMCLDLVLRGAEHKSSVIPRSSRRIRPSSTTAHRFGELLVRPGYTRYLVEVDLACCRQQLATRRSDVLDSGAGRRVTQR